MPDVLSWARDDPQSWGPHARSGSALAVGGLLFSVPWQSWPAPSSLVVAIGLGALAGTDIARRLIPRFIFRGLSIATGAALIVTSLLSDNWQPTERAVMACVLTVAVLGPLWWVAPGAFAFGDLKVSVVATGAAASVAWSATFVMWFVAGAVGLGIALVAGQRNPDTTRRMAQGIPFVPCLAAGFVVGVATV